MNKLFKFGIIAWIVSFIISIALIAAVFNVAWHFISKYW